MAASCTFLLTHPLPDPASSIMHAAGSVEVLERDTLQRRVAVGDPVVLVTQLTDPVDAALLGAGDVRGVSNYAAGVDNIDLTAAASLQIRIGHTPDVLTAPTADIAILLMLATTRRLLEGDALVRSGEFEGWRPDLLLGMSADGARLGLLGAGRIAEAVARRAAAFEMEVVYATVGSRGVHERPIDQIARRVSFEDLLTSSDVVSLHVPLAPNTRHLIGAAELTLLKRTAVLVNTARGAVIDEAALVHALARGDIAGAGLDVYEDEPALAPGLADLRNVTLLPHLGSATRQARSRMAEICAQNAVALATGAALEHEVPRPPL